MKNCSFCVYDEPSSVFPYGSPPEYKYIAAYLDIPFHAVLFILYIPACNNIPNLELNSFINAL